MSITLPNGPKRRLACENSLEWEVLRIVDKACLMGWTRDEVLLAISDIRPSHHTTINRVAATATPNDINISAFWPTSKVSSPSSRGRESGVDGGAGQLSMTRSIIKISFSP